jgi:hypothetical protein
MVFEAAVDEGFAIASAIRHVRLDQDRGPDPGGLHPGLGIIAKGTVADKRTEASLTAYPGGVVDRIVELSNGDYEVHNIGVNWPHHVFFNHDFKGHRRRRLADAGVACGPA